MIKRTYFFSAYAHLNDGSKLVLSQTVDYSGFTSNPSLVLDKIKDRIHRAYGVNVDDIVVTAFNRV